MSVVQKTEMKNKNDYLIKKNNYKNISEMSSQSSQDAGEKIKMDILDKMEMKKKNDYLINKNNNKMTSSMMAKIEAAKCLGIKTCGCGCGNVPSFRKDFPYIGDTGDFEAVQNYPPPPWVLGYDNFKNGSEKVRIEAFLNDAINFKVKNCNSSYYLSLMKSVVETHGFETIKDGRIDTFDNVKFGKLYSHRGHGFIFLKRNKASIRVMTKTGIKNLKVYKENEIPEIRRGGEYINYKDSRYYINDFDNLDLHQSIVTIQRAWNKCRWNPKYKMCEKVQLKNLEIETGMEL